MCTLFIMFYIFKGAARRQYETLKRQTQAELKHSLTQILEGSEKVSLLIVLLYLNLTTAYTLKKGK